MQPSLENTPLEPVARSTVTGKYYVKERFYLILVYTSYSSAYLLKRFI
ncbi:hypothetical protein [Capnocytophaga catalasegens]|nr:hypothetical protein [Capnocytophaga catalasegens]